jgi:hypothetical protein
MQPGTLLDPEQLLGWSRKTRDANGLTVVVEDAPSVGGRVVVALKDKVAATHLRREHAAEGLIEWFAWSGE